MRMKSFLPAMLFGAVAVWGLCGCGEKISVVDSGAYTGAVEKVNADEQEIYVRLSDKKLIELYFTEETTLQKDGNEVKFSQLSAGQSVQVEVKRVGNRLDPISVKIVE